MLVQHSVECDPIRGSSQVREANARVERTRQLCAAHATGASPKTKPTATKSPAAICGRLSATLTKPATPSTSPCAKSRRATSSAPKRHAHRRARHRALLLLREPEADGVRHGRQLLGGDRLEDRRELSVARELRGLLPEKYSPLRANGDRPQSVYLAEVGRPFAAALFRLIGGEANKVADVAKEVVVHMSPSREPDLEQWEDRVEVVNKNPKIPDTEAEAIIQARVGLRKVSRQRAGSRARVSGDKGGAAGAFGREPYQAVAGEGEAARCGGTRWVTNCAFPALPAYTTQLASRLQNATLKMTNQINELNLKVTNCDLKDVVAGE
jgi:hypothetical protein